MVSGVKTSVLNVVNKWDMSRVRQRLVYKGVMSESDALQREPEYKKYLALIFSNPGEAFPLPAPIDDFGHAHISFTEDARSLAQAVGVSHIQHEPTASAAEEAALLPQYLQKTIPSLKAAFGQLNEALWPLNRCVCLWQAPPN